jgi:hypothetical protein
VIDIYKIKFSKDKLRQFTPQERAFFFLFGYSLNQMAIFKKLVVFSSNRTPEAPVHEQVSGAQTQILVRHMVGVAVTLGSGSSNTMLTTIVSYKSSGTSPIDPAVGKGLRESGGAG